MRAAHVTTRTRRGCGTPPGARARRIAALPRRLRARERFGEALALRLQGVTWRDVARRVGLRSASNVCEGVQRLLREQVHDDIEHLRALENARPDALQAAVWAQATAGDLDAIATVLGIMKRRATLNALDVPPPNPAREAVIDQQVTERLEALLGPIVIGFQHAIETYVPPELHTDVMAAIRQVARATDRNAAGNELFSPPRSR